MAILEGKTALVTGGASGLGKAISEQMINEGAKVIIADVSGQELNVAESLGPSASSIHLDVSDADSVQELERYLDDNAIRLDIVANNAGINGPNTLTHEYAIEEYDKVQSVNSRGMFLVLQVALRNMLKHGGGSIVNTASIGSFFATPGASAYITSKGAAVMMTKTAALEYADKNIRVNAIAPGIINTPFVEKLDKDLIDFLEGQVPQKRLGEAKEAASVAVFLASDAASHVTGQAWVIDGGRSAG